MLSRINPEPRRRRVIGIDPGLASTGWGIVELVSSKIIYIAHGCFKTEASLPRSERLLQIYNEISIVLNMFEPNEAGMETLYFVKNITSGLPVAEARGVLSLAIAQRGLQLGEYSPKAIKQAVVGTGAAEKAQVQEMVRLILGLKAVPKPDHAADALGAAICRVHDPLFDLRRPLHAG